MGQIHEPAVPDIQVLINEAYPDPDRDIDGNGIADQNDEFIELYNPGDDQVDLEGLVLTDNVASYVIPSIIIPPKGYVVLDRSMTGLMLGIDDNLTLKEGAEIIDNLPWSDAKKGYSMQRSPDGDERVRVVKDPTPGSSNRRPPNIIVNEIMVDPQGKNGGKQWLELRNNGDGEDLKDIRITNGEGVDLCLPRTFVEPGGRAIVCIGDSERVGPYPDDVPLIELGSDDALFVNGDDIQVVDPDGYSMDYVAWGASTHVGAPLDLPGRTNWTGRHYDPAIGNMTDGSDNPSIEEGISISRHPDGTDTGSPGDFVPTSGLFVSGLGSTPGWDNRLDPSVRIESGPDTIYVNMSTRKDVMIAFSTYGTYGTLRTNVTLAGEGWAMDGGGETPRDISEPGGFAIEIEIGSPMVLESKRARLDIEAIWDELPWFRNYAQVQLVVPTVELSIGDPMVSLSGKDSDIVPQGSVPSITCRIENKGELPNPESILTMTVSTTDRVLTRSDLPLPVLQPGRYRSFGFDLDTIQLIGNITVMLEADPDRNVTESERSDNRWSRNISVIGTPLTRGEASLLITGLIWNTTAAGTMARIFNPDLEGVDISGFLLTDGVYSMGFPKGAWISPGESISIAWGGEALERCPDPIVYRGDAAGPSIMRMTLGSRSPDPRSTGTLMLMSDHRKTIDEVRVFDRGADDGQGWKWLSSHWSETTWGVLLSRTRDSKGDHIDSNTSLDWTCNLGNAWIRSFCPSPDPGMGSEFIIIGFDDGVDPSGFTLVCGDRYSTVPNGTLIEGDGLLAFARDPELFLFSQGHTPDLTFGEPLSISEELTIPGTRTGGPSTFILPDQGAELCLKDPGGIILERIEWGNGGLGPIGRDEVIHRPDKGVDDRWYVMGQASSPLGLDLLGKGIGLENISLYPDRTSAAIATLGNDKALVRSDGIDQSLYAVLMDHLRRGSELEILLDDPPWCSEDEEMDGGSRDRLMLDQARSLLDAGAMVRHRAVAGTVDYDPFISAGNRIMLTTSLPRRASSDAGPSQVQAVLDFSTALAAQELTKVLIGRSDIWEDSETALLGISTDPIDPDGYDHIEMLYKGPVHRIEMNGSYLVPITVIPDFSGSDSDMTLVRPRSETDLMGLLDLMRKGHGCGLFIGPQDVYPTLDLDGTYRSLAFAHLYGNSPVLERPFGNLLARAASLEHVAMEEGFGMELGVTGNGFPHGMGGAITAGSAFYLSIGDRTGNGFWIGGNTTSCEEVERITEGIRSCALPFPSGMLGMKGSGKEVLPSDWTGLVIDEVYFDTYLIDDPDEYVCIRNDADRPIDLAGCSISDDEGLGYHNDGTILMMGGSVLMPGQRVFVARNASTYLHQNGVMPDHSWDRGDNDPYIMLTEGEMVMVNGNDSVCLRDPHGTIIDVVPYGRCIWDHDPWDRAIGGGWSGVPVPDPGWGHVLYRYRPWTGECSDSDTARDWSTLRPRYPGQSRLPPYPGIANASLRIGVCPYSSSDLLLETIESARSELKVNVYEITSTWIASALIGACERGVEVQVLVEGGPVGGVSAVEMMVLGSLLASGASVRMLTNDLDVGIRDRYRFDHAKYIISDGRMVLVSSDNFKDSSFPPKGRLPISGTRGWVVQVRSRGLAEQLLSVFEDDWRGHDAILLDGSDVGDNVAQTAVTEVEMIEMGEDVQGPSPWFESGMVVLMASPDHLSLFDNPLFSVIGSAREEVSVELLDLATTFDMSSSEKALYPIDAKMVPSYPGTNSSNPYLASLFSAAISGARVRLILDGTDFDMDGRPDNAWIAEWVREEAVRNGLSDRLMVQLMPGTDRMVGDKVGMVHNKGLIVDVRYFWVSSMNWGPTSSMENREIGLLIDCPQAAMFLKDVFDHDWGLTLLDEVRVSKEVISVKPSHDGRIECELTLGVTSVGNISLCLTDDPSSAVVADGNVQWTDVTGGRSVVGLVFHGRDPEDGELHVLAKDGDRIITVLVLDLGEVSDTGPTDWSYPVHKEPVVAIALVVLTAIGISVILALIRSRKRIPGSSGTPEE